MTESVVFNNDWISPTGNTILDILESKNITISAFASKIGFSISEANLLIQSEVALTDELAEILSATIGASKSFWINRESQFRQDLARRQVAKINSKVESDWLKTLPIDDLVIKGWISNVSTTTDKIRACLKLFNVENIAEWTKASEEKLASYAFKKSNSHKQEFGATATWLIQAEIIASEIETENLDLELFHKKLSDIKELTREPNPQIFLPKLREIAASCGVAIAVVKTPKGCRASGAAKIINPNKAILILSFRYLSDDQFWFAFFHEAGHLILHGNQIIFENDNLSAQETEANDFAYETLIPKEHQDELQKISASHIAIIRYSRKLNISRGIVVGQLQKSGKLRFGQFNNLKIKYNWFGDSPNHEMQ
ncbi:MAG: ImmA/IrrE family metallo-endopeptidase [Methylotenera sp.]|uniref:ImmA/IrrE family metallo-endopeptidase n=1 Tax=Methylotenera sp. TaxID=2051956 RepID=UPI002488F665|nr:ImmA/IrrE family metallo-endopeptidase [Methylotenera sp.]MDI1309724.1 ImmA/IrrE family metallo-endopeptidase [Methylotenera sp.]